MNIAEIQDLSFYWESSCDNTWDYRGILVVDFLYRWRLVNAVYYCQLLDEVELGSRGKGPIRSAILLCGNARPHTAALTREKLDKIQWKTPEHPPYSPDLSSHDYHMYGPLKEELGHHFDGDDDVKTFVRNGLRTRQDSFFDDGIKNFRFGAKNMWIKEEII